MTNNSAIRDSRWPVVSVSDCSFCCVGSGKSFLLAAVASKLKAHKLPVCYIDCFQLLRYCKDLPPNVIAEYLFEELREAFGPFCDELLPTAASSSASEDRSDLVKQTREFLLTDCGYTQDVQTLKEWSKNWSRVPSFRMCFVVDQWNSLADAAGDLDQVKQCKNNCRVMLKAIMSCHPHVLCSSGTGTEIIETLSRPVRGTSEKLHSIHGGLNNTVSIRNIALR